jgi:hypothetical protein
MAYTIFPFIFQPRRYNQTDHDKNKIFSWLSISSNISIKLPYAAISTYQF